MIDDSDLDNLLAVPLDVVADDGFTARIAHRIEQKELWDERLFWGLPALAACALAPFLPLQELTDAILRLGPLIAGSATFSIAAAAVVLTISFERRFREGQSAL